MRLGRPSRPKCTKLLGRKPAPAAPKASPEAAPPAAKPRAAAGKTKARSSTRKLWMKRNKKPAPVSRKMGVFYIAFRVERFPDMAQGRTISRGLVDSGAEFTWAPEQDLQDLGIAPVKAESFTTADGKIIKRHIGFAVVRVTNRFTVD